MGPHPDQQVNMIWHAVNPEHFVLIALYSAGDEFVQFLFPGGVDAGVPVPGGEYKLIMDLGVGVSHNDKV